MEYYHITQHEQNYEVGDEIIIQGNNNYYNRLLNTANQQSDFLNTKGKIFDSLNKNNLNLNQAYPKLLTEYKQMIQLFQSYFTLIREDLFDRIRYQHYPGVPSRKNCIWLIDNIDWAYYWHKKLTKNGHKRQVFKVALDSPYSTRKCAEKPLKLDFENESDTISKAHAYWRGDIQDGEPYEILYDGKITLVEQV